MKEPKPLSEGVSTGRWRPERVLTNEQLERMVARVVGNLTLDPDNPNQTYQITILNSPNINAFALNFRHAPTGRETQGRLNEDVEEANYLMQRVVESLSVDSPTDDPTRIPLYLTSTEFSDELYGDCKRRFMKRLGLKDSTQDLMVLRKVVM
jgi:hypothetical protein